MRSRRITRPRFTRRDIPEHAGLAGDFCACSDCDVTAKPRLSRKHAAISNIRRAGDANLRHDEAQLSYFDVVSYLNKIVDLRSRADDRVIDAAAINGSVSADLDVVPDYASTNMRNLCVSTIR
jgi:hypothetical protein